MVCSHGYDKRTHKDVLEKLGMERKALSDFNALVI